jgi:hypothetical protein
MDDRRDGEPEVEVYANGVAFDVVKGWLGDSARDLEWRSWYGVEDVDADRPARQERLGLGATFLSHTKATRLMGGVQKKLGRAVAQSRSRAEAEAKEDGAAARSSRGGGGGRRVRASASASASASDDESDDDAGGRAAVSFGGKRKTPPAYDPTKDPALVGGRGGAGVPGAAKKKKKKKNKS